MFKERNYNFKANGKGYKQNVKLNAKWHKKNANLAIVARRKESELLPFNLFSCSGHRF